MVRLDRTISKSKLVLTGVVWLMARSSRTMAVGMAGAVKPDQRGDENRHARSFYRASYRASNFPAAASA
jgi:hypothetical protein